MARFMSLFLRVLMASPYLSFGRQAPVYFVYAYLTCICPRGSCFITVLLLPTVWSTRSPRVAPDTISLNLAETLKAVC